MGVTSRAAPVALVFSSVAEQSDTLEGWVDTFMSRVITSSQRLAMLVNR